MHASELESVRGDRASGDRRDAHRWMLRAFLAEDEDAHAREHGGGADAERRSHEDLRALRTRVVVVLAIFLRLIPDARILAFAQALLAARERAHVMREPHADTDQREPRDRDADA